jgi:small subunit ribosomal protein S8
MTDQIADLLIRIKNAYLASKQTVVVSSSTMNLAIAQVLLDHQYLTALEKSELHGHPTLLLSLRYVNDQPALTAVKRISKPGRRTYVTSRAIPAVLKGFGISILSTSQGVMTGATAKEKNLGGELLCEIW